MDTEHDRRDEAWRVSLPERTHGDVADHDGSDGSPPDGDPIDREDRERRLSDAGQPRPFGADGNGVPKEHRQAVADSGPGSPNGLPEHSAEPPGGADRPESQIGPSNGSRPYAQDRNGPEAEVGQHSSGSLTLDPSPSAEFDRVDGYSASAAGADSSTEAVAGPLQPDREGAGVAEPPTVASEAVQAAPDRAARAHGAASQQKGSTQKSKSQDPDSEYVGPRIDRVVRHLLKNEIVTQEQVELAKEAHIVESSREALWRTLARITGVNRDAVFSEAARVYAFPTARMGDGTPDHDFVRLVMETFEETRRDDLLRLIVLPMEYQVEPTSGAAKLIFATHDPARPEVNRILQELKLGRIELQYAPELAIRQLIAEIFPKQNEYLQRISDDPFAVDLGAAYEEEGELVDRDALEAEISRSQLINLVEATLVEATRQGASDIHIFPNPHRQIEIHFRVDGRLKLWHREERIPAEAFLAVVKDNAMNVDRFDSDMAQDGFIQRRIDDALIRFRVSVLPIATASQETRAESIVIRVLDDRKVLSDLTKLGMLDVALKRFHKAIRLPHGMVILTGPTGSGKSTTLVAALHQVVTPDVNVLTVEDPVEYIIKGVRQIKLSHKLRLEQALRAILRHDPDVVMVGEMRDRETAELAIKLANTGHLTFSTLHTNDAPSAVSRLYKMGIEPFLIAYAINLVVAQRLIRNLCPDCKQEDRDVDRVMLEELGFSKQEIEETKFYRPGTDTKCRRCHGNHYSGRRALCEALFFSREIRHMIVQSGQAIDEDAIRKQAVADGMLTLLDSAREVVKMGDTSIDELLRTTAAE